MSKSSRFHSRKGSSKPGLTQGLLDKSVVPELAKAIKLIAYKQNKHVELELSNLQSIDFYLAEYDVIWLDINFPITKEIAEELHLKLKIHNLILEDIVNEQRRPKLEKYENQKFLVVESLDFDEYIIARPIWLIVNDKFVITFKHNTNRQLESVLTRIKTNQGVICLQGSNYLAYAIIDTVIDHYFPVIDSLSNNFEIIEDKIIKSPNDEVLSLVHNLKQDLLLLRRTIWPMREVLSQLQHYSEIFQDTELSLYMRDCYDHILNLMDITETYRELVSDLTNMYLSSVSNRMNEIMKVLTIVSTIFIPPSFIAAVYGMNFNAQKSPFNMPETNWYYGYPLCLFLMIVMVLSIYYYIKKNGWLR